MPIYQYECSLCRCQFERKQHFDDDTVLDCPKCHGKAYRIFNPVPVIFKGSGFYVTDSRKVSDGSEKSEKKPTTGKN